MAPGTQIVLMILGSLLTVIGAFILLLLNINRIEVTKLWKSIDALTKRLTDFQQHVAGDYIKKSDLHDHCQIMHHTEF